MRTRGPTHKNQRTTGFKLRCSHHEGHTHKMKRTTDGGSGTQKNRDGSSMSMQSLKFVNERDSIVAFSNFTGCPFRVHRFSMPTRGSKISRRMKLTTLGTWAVILFLVTVMLVGALYRIPVSNAQGNEYVLHVWGGVTCMGSGSFVSYSGDYSGFELPPFDIGPVSSPFTVTLTAATGVGCHPRNLLRFHGLEP